MLFWSITKKIYKTKYRSIIQLNQSARLTQIIIDVADNTGVRNCQTSIFDNPSISNVNVYRGFTTQWPI